MFKTLLLASSLAAGSYAAHLETQVNQDVKESEILADIFIFDLRQYLYLHITDQIFLPQAADFSYPGDNCCAVYSGKNFTGKRIDICHDKKNKVTYTLNSETLYENVNAIYCGKNVQYDLIDKDDSASQWVQRGAGLNRIGELGWDDISKIVLQPYDVETKGAVVTFDTKDCKGYPGRYFGPSRLGDIIEYPSEKHIDKKGYTQANDIESVMVPYGYAIELYENEGFLGAKQVIRGPMFIGHNELMQCINLNEGVNNAVSSLRVFKVKRLGHAVGEWQGITHSDKIDVTITTGFSSEHSEENQLTNAWSLSYEMSTGVEGVNQKKVSASYAGSIISDVFETMKETEETEIGIKCTERGDQVGVGLWQYVVKSNDGLTVVKTSHTVCRYGAGVYDKAPECPWNACANAQCTECKSDFIEVQPKAE